MAISEAAVEMQEDPHEKQIRLRQQQLDEKEQKAKFSKPIPVPSSKRRLGNNLVIAKKIKLTDE